MELCIGAARLNFRGTQDAASEAVIVDRCRRQDVEAFGRFVDMYQNRVFGFVKRMVPTAEEASDVTQEVFIKAFQHFPRFDARSSARTWLFRIAHNLCIDRSRKGDRTPVMESLVLDDSSEVLDVRDDRWEPEQIAIDGELMDVVERGLSEMSEKLRSVLLLHDREDMSYEEIAATLGTPVGTVKSRLFLARAHLQQVVRQYLELETRP